MKKNFRAEAPFWNLFPDVEIAVIVAEDINNHENDKIPANLLEKANCQAIKWIPDNPISSNDVISDWRKAFQKFKTKKGARCAVESLLKRAKQGKGVTSINPIVDVYNSVSLNWAFPVAGEDLAKIEGDIRLTVASGGEKFWPIGEKEEQEAMPNEVIYTDDHSILSRCWSWRDSARVEVTENTSDALFYMENVNPKRQNDHRKAVAELQTKLKQYFNCDSQVGYITKNSPSILLLTK
ncbi:hypothetical protein FC65_GL001475 [Ligilactobacillus acidipiscis DSM 15836]|uniref:Solo B3/4 domain (OB-fold DNA/RNA-binding) of Phe-aaRS-beta n=2 Tax=Ligilactobacillus acidipiscis TaxID=89059 RepID=A0A0R2JKY0_9LACO|nr:phenylalanine--tRNA ligase beta subunit-related protein [Ligilactobacillus acidipiscis]KRM29083.1 hypothetical protein FC65_GL001475 [Ligilactobacillus acidipiscis DSM 15836]KRN76534.1 hypothetical protein IV43_GL000781 [Ligilactobacillus acidipiscis]SFV41611.1 Solo B3/4 domain (OB-fold DNA/RNA-binding) of Phe-aaRS-beta [Ligilactobacillus acidipiscis]GAW64086.1 B3/4 domain protein [Ligilactobacillus acidipiscis]GEN20973.1 hypothetical protein LAC02_42540 [Ligilactobacillus acidipiscis]